MISSEFVPISGGVTPFSGEVVVALFYTSFLIGMAIAYIFRDRYKMRQLCVGVFILCLLMVNIGGIHVFPFVNLQKYTQTKDNTVTQYDIRVVDEHGQELRLDPRAAEPIRPDKIADTFALHYSAEERNQTFRHIYSEVTAYREHVQSRSGIRSSALRFPEHDFGDRWSKSELQRYGRFVAVRIIKVEKTFVNDSTEVIIEDEQVYEWSPDGRLAEDNT